MEHLLQNICCFIVDLMNDRLDSLAFKGRQV